MKRVYLATALTCLVVLAAACLVFLRKGSGTESDMVIGFIYENDESTPYTYNFAKAERTLTEEMGDKVKIISRRNISLNDAEDTIRELVRLGCKVIFTNSHSDKFRELAQELPQTQMCQVSYLDELSGAVGDVPENYHTFMGEIYQGRYASGVAAGYQLKDLLDQHLIVQEDALVGYVGAYSNAEVISGFTAFLLGVRSVVPDAKMKVRYINSWADYGKEREAARKLIDEGCVVISSHCDTIGCAVACEEAAADRKLYFVGYNQSMMDEAPTTALISTRINWSQYILEAVQAVRQGKRIEDTVNGKVHENDMSAGLDLDWVQLLELNSHIALDGTDELLEETIDGLKKGRIHVFQGDYIGVDPDNPEDTIDLRDGYVENEYSSSPSFHYILQDVIIIEE